MRKIPVWITAIFLTGEIYPVQSQTCVIEDFKPTSGNQPGKEYPMVGPAPHMEPLPGAGSPEVPDDHSE